MDYWFWIWVGAAVLLSVAEIFTAGFFMLPIGLGAAVAAVLAWFDVALVWQWVAFLGSSAIFFLALRRVADKLTHEPPQKVGVDRLIGKRGVVIEALLPHSGEGRVRVNREEWRADTPEDGPLPVGTPVVVISVSGTHLVVEPVDESSGDAE